MKWTYELRRDSYEYPHCEEWREKSAADIEKCEIFLHHNIEVMYIIEGSIVLDLMSLNGIEKRITLCAGQAMIINCNILHRAAACGELRYYTAFIPPNCLMTPLRIEVGKTFIKPYDDTDGKLRPLFSNMENFTLRPDDPIKNVLMTSSANTVMGLILPSMSAYMRKVYGSPVKADILTYVYKNYRNPGLTVEAILRNFGYSRKTLTKFFRESVGQSPKNFIDFLRVNDAKTILKETNHSIESVAHETGFDSVRTFFRVFQNHTGMTPGEFRDK